MNKFSAVLGSRSILDADNDVESLWDRLRIKVSMNEEPLSPESYTMPCRAIVSCDDTLL